MEPLIFENIKSPVRLRYSECWYLVLQGLSYVVSFGVGEPRPADSEGLFILLPALDLQVILRECAESLDEGRCQASIGHQWNVVVDGATTDSVTISQLALGMILRNVDDEVELVVGNHLHHVRHILVVLVWPTHGSSLDVVLVEELRCTGSSVDGVTILHQRLGSVEQRSLLLGTTA